MRRRFLGKTLLTVGMLVGFAGAVSAAGTGPANDSFVTKKSISSAAVMRAIAACQALAAKNGWPETVVVVDEAGNEMGFLKMDGAGISTIAFAEGKARTALRVQSPSSFVGDMLAKGDYKPLTWGLFAAEGGLPIKLDDRSIGAIGASGSTGANDVLCAQAGIDAALK